MLKFFKKIYHWIKHKIKHKIEHWSWEHIKGIFKKHGLALVIIFITWEILEDILFPVLFIWLGNNVSPWFYGGAPISWLLCLHPIMVPLIWGLWIKLSGQKEDVK